MKLIETLPIESTFILFPLHPLFYNLDIFSLIRFFPFNINVYEKIQIIIFFFISLL